MNFKPPNKSVRDSIESDMMRSLLIIIDHQEKLMESNKAICSLLVEMMTILKEDKPVEYNHDRKPVGVYSEVSK